MKERIQKVLANAGVDSRRNIEEMILQGRISVNGRVAKRMPVMVDPEVDKIEVDGEPVKLKNSKVARRVYILMNKPKGVYCTNVSQGVQKRAIDLLPEGFPYRVYPVGRLDAESRGLLLLTNDGDLTNQLTHPRYGIAKTYVADVEGYVQQVDIDRLNRGIWLADTGGHGSKVMPNRVKIMNRGRDGSTLELTVREGRGKPVRQMLAGIGHKVTRLTRIQMGKLTMKGVGVGKWRFLTSQEVKDLQKEARRASEAADLRQRKTSTPPVQEPAEGAEGAEE